MTSVAQTKISGTIKCGGKPDFMQVIPAGDREDHKFGVEQNKCTWIKPIEIAGLKAKDHMTSEEFESTGTTALVNGVGVATMGSGDKAFSSYHGKSTFKSDGYFIGGNGTWQFTGGTGKLQGIKGKGTFKCAPDADTITCGVDGEYQLGI